MQFVRLSTLLLTVVAAQACTHNKTATVLPKGGGSYEIIGQAATEQTAYANAESEAKYTCESKEKEMIVVDSSSVYQGADKDAKDDVEATNVALAFVTGRSGKERNADDYKVTLVISCK